VCEDGYVETTTGICEQCDDSSYVAIAVILPVVIIAVFALALYVNINWASIRLMLANVVLKLADQAEKYHFSSLRTKVKIMITFIQVLSQMPSVVGPLFGPFYLSFLQIFSIINFNVLSFFNLDCLYKTNYYSALMYATIGPFVLIALVLLSFLMKKLWLRNTFAPYPMKQLRRDVLTATLMISFFIFSPTSITIFQCFTCEHFDDGSNMLVADYSVDCEAPEHTFFVAYASVMVLIYPVGIPLMYFYLLFYYHDMVNPSRRLVVRDEERHLVDRRIIQAEKIKLRETYEEIQHISFLFENYSPKRWYFEVLDCIRRLFLTAIPVLILRGTIVQLLLVLIASLIWCIIYMQLRPFQKPNDNTVAIMAQWAISFTLLGGIMLKVDTSTESAQYYVVDVLLIFINVAVICSTVYIACVIKDVDPLEEMKEDALHLKKKYGGSKRSSRERDSDDSTYRSAEMKMRNSSASATSSSEVSNPIVRNAKIDHSGLSTPLTSAPIVPATRKNSALGSSLFAAARRASAREETNHAGLGKGKQKQQNGEDSDDED
jgi:hypothetical protein